MTSTPEVTASELISIAGARALRGSRRVFAGIGIPTLAVALAQRTTAPEIELVYESGICGAHPPRLPETIGDASLATDAESIISLPGSGGAVEVMANCGEVFVVMRRHDPRSFVEWLDFCTTPSPQRARREQPTVPAPGKGVTTVITNLGVLTMGGSGELELSAVHPGVGVDEVVQATGWPLRAASDVVTTEAPDERGAAAAARRDRPGPRLPALIGSCCGVAVLGMPALPR